MYSNDMGISSIENIFYYEYRSIRLCCAMFGIMIGIIIVVGKVLYICIMSGCDISIIDSDIRIKGIKVCGGIFRYRGMFRIRFGISLYVDNIISCGHHGVIGVVSIIRMMFMYIKIISSMFSGDSCIVRRVSTVSYSFKCHIICYP